MSTEWKDLLHHVDGEPSFSTTASSSLETEQGRNRDNHNSNKKNKTSDAVDDNQISDWEAGVSLAKAIMGAGSFALPWAFSKMGYVAGPIFMTILLTMSVYSIQLLVQCCAVLRRKQQSEHSATTMICSYVDVARSSFGTTGARCAYVASMSASVGVCGSYLVFIAANLQSLLQTSYYDNDSPDSSTRLSQTALIWMILPVAVLLSAVRDMKYFALASFFGDVSVILGMVVVMIYGTMDTTSSTSRNSWTEGCVAVGSPRDMALAFGSIGYLFLVHFLVIPIESSMERPQHFSKVATTTFSACAIMSGLFGILGYLMFGAETEQIVLLNVRQGSFFVTSVKVLLCIDLILTYPVVMRPSIVILEESVDQVWEQRQHDQQKKSSPSTATASRPLARSVDGTTHVLVCTALGIVAASASRFVPAFGLLSGLVGGVSQTFLAFVLPPLMWAKHQQQSPSLFRVFQTLPSKEKALVICGFVLIVWTLHSAWTELSGDTS
jgi:solute carrier family 36 (proton-coupled amino acid transporter)